MVAFLTRQKNDNKKIKQSEDGGNVPCGGLATTLGGVPSCHAPSLHAILNSQYPSQTLTTELLFDEILQSGLADMKFLFI